MCGHFFPRFCKEETISRAYLTWYDGPALFEKLADAVGKPALIEITIDTADQSGAVHAPTVHAAESVGNAQIRLSQFNNA